MQGKKVLVTGSEGLIGAAIVKKLQARGAEIVRLDVRGDGQVWRGDVRNPLSVAQAMDGCTGIIHLAAVSRVLWGQQYPELCWETNVGGTRNVLEAATRMKNKPWVIFSSSREVYGQPESLPAHEDTTLVPTNIYGRSKVAGEKLVTQARSSGLSTVIVRFSNVYGSISDHQDRVVPAFALASLKGDPLRVEGLGHTFDFNHLDDTACGLEMLAQRMEEGASNLPPLHFVTGEATTLGELASMAIDLTQSRSEIRQAAPRSYDVARFVGNPARAQQLLGWKPRIALREGLKRLIQDYRQLSAHNDARGSAA